MRSLHRVDVNLLLLVRHRDKLAHSLLQFLQRRREVANVLAEDLVGVNHFEQVDNVFKREVEESLEDFEEATEEVVEQGGERLE